MPRVHSPGILGVLSTKSENSLLEHDSVTGPLLDTTFSVTEICLFYVHSIFSSLSFIQEQRFPTKLNRGPSGFLTMNKIFFLNFNPVLLLLLI